LSRRAVFGSVEFGAILSRPPGFIPDDMAFSALRYDKLYAVAVDIKSTVAKAVLAVLKKDDSLADMPKE